MHDFLIGNNQIDKHLKYLSKYGGGELYWGLGIENEVYLEFDKKIAVDNSFFLNNHKSERYSVNYFKNYKDNKYLEEAFLFYLNEYLKEEKKDRNKDGYKDGYKDKNKENNIILPFLINSHSFSKTDKNNNPTKLYTTKNQDNPDFNGKLLLDEIIEDNKYLKESMNYNWLFDGDTIEFTTNNFYKAKLNDVFQELYNNKKYFIDNLNDVFIKKNIFQKYGPIKYMENNHPFSIYLTNSNNISMFNNGTLNYNITLPTELDENGKIKNKKKFIEEHSRAIKIIQWMEPFILAVYGAPDPFSLMEKFSHKDKFSKSSQRCAVSRYISIGTYNCDKMEPGKILLKKIDDLECNKNSYWWFHEYYKDNAYKKLDIIGMDINFNKHFNHGIELRFFDHIVDEKDLEKSFEFIIYLMDYILSVDPEKIDNFKCSSESKVWNKFVLNTLKYGKTYELNPIEKKIYESIFNIKIYKDSVEDIYEEIFLNLLLKFNYFCNTIQEENKYILIPSGSFSSLTLNIQHMEYNNLVKEMEKIKDDNLNDNLNDNFEEIYEGNCTEFFKESYGNEESLNSVFLKKEENNCCIIS